MVPLAVATVALWFLPRVFVKHGFRILNELRDSGVQMDKPARELPPEQARAVIAVYCWALAARWCRRFSYLGAFLLVLMALV